MSRLFFFDSLVTYLLFLSIERRGQSRNFLRSLCLNDGLRLFLPISLKLKWWEFTSCKLQFDGFLKTFQAQDRLLQPYFIFLEHDCGLILISLFHLTLPLQLSLLKLSLFRLFLQLFLLNHELCEFFLQFLCFYFLLVLLLTLPLFLFNDHFLNMRCLLFHFFCIYLLFFYFNL